MSHCQTVTCPQHFILFNSFLQEADKEKCTLYKPMILAPMPNSTLQNKGAFLKQFGLENSIILCKSGSCFFFKEITLL